MAEFDPHYQDAVAREIRKEFFAQKTALMGKTYRPHANQRSFVFWQRAAAQAIRLGAPPDAYVRAAFAHCRLSTGPFPNALAGQAAARWWAEYANLHPSVKTLPPGGDLLSGPSGAARELMDDIAYARAFLGQVTGELGWPPGPATCELLRAGTLSAVPPHIRAIFGCGDPYIARRYGKEMMQYLAEHPEKARAMHEVGIDMVDLLRWLRGEQHGQH